MTVKKVSYNDVSSDNDLKPKKTKVKQKQERWIKNALRSNNVSVFYAQDGFGEDYDALDFEEYD
jgi:hypothetical protein